MDSKRKNKIIEEIYQKMFFEATPPIDYNKLVHFKITKIFGWNWYYFLSEKKQSQIIFEICKKYKCTKEERQNIFSIIVEQGNTPLFTSEDFAIKE